MTGSEGSNGTRANTPSERLMTAEIFPYNFRIENAIRSGGVEKWRGSDRREACLLPALSDAGAQVAAP
jgi:hypothetical protein